MGAQLSHASATRLTDESLYSGRLVRNRDGRWLFLAFHNTGTDGHFIGELTDPLPVSWSADGTQLLLTSDSTEPATSPSAH